MNTGTARKREELPNSQLDLMFRVVPQWGPMLELLGTATGFASLTSERLATTSNFKRDCSWLGLVHDDEGPEVVVSGLSAFNKDALSWLLLRANVVAVFSGIRSAAPYSRVVRVALAGHRVVIIETNIERQRDWVTQVERRSRAPVSVISREALDAEIRIRGVEP